MRKLLPNYGQTMAKLWRNFCQFDPIMANSNKFYGHLWSNKDKIKNKLTNYGETMVDLKQFYGQFILPHNDKTIAILWPI